MPGTLVIISHWAPRGLQALTRLVRQMAQTRPGQDYSLCVVSNHDRTDDAQDAFAIAQLEASLAEALKNQPWPPQNVQTHLRENTGMNIGAWDHGWQCDDTYEHYLFLQDEVLLQREHWLALLTKRAQDACQSGKGLYLLGESFNTRWQLPWATLRQSPLNVFAPGHPCDMRRVDYYLHCMHQWGIDPGTDGGHLRSLVWLSNQQTLQCLNGFRQGRQYGECIAAEIATSRAVVAAGGVVQQIAPSPFCVFWHPEWRKDGLGKNKLLEQRG